MFYRERVTHATFSGPLQFTVSFSRCHWVKILHVPGYNGLVWFLRAHWKAYDVSLSPKDWDFSGYDEEYTWRGSEY